MYGHRHMSADTHGVSQTLDGPELEVQKVMSHLTWVLVANSGPPRAVGALNRGAALQPWQASTSICRPA